MNLLNFDSTSREKAWIYVAETLEAYYKNTKKWKVNPALDLDGVKNFIGKYNFDQGIEIAEAIDHVMDGFREFHVHTPHPLYLGLFNPRANFPSIIGDAIASTINPQMAAWSHAPFANEIENYIVQKIGYKFGFKEAVDGVFTTGGTEANLTALCTAIRQYFPDVKENGWRSISENPILYTSQESHHSVLKAAVVTGLGKQAVRNIPSDEKLSMDIGKLEKAIKKDLEVGNMPFMVVATAGTTGAGGFDNLNLVKKICTKYNLWMHVDAAYGGACAFSKDHRYLLGGIEKADSVTFDAHKWLSVPMGAGIFMTKHKNILTDTFQINAQYMPKEAEGMNISDPYNHSIQWSRRFIGLKLYLALLVIGWEGYEQSISEDFRIGKLLKNNLEKSGWKIYNKTELPIICFNKADKIEDSEWTKNLAYKLVATRKIWISTFPVADKLCLRACITNYMTRDNEVEEIVSLINEAAQPSL